MEAVREREHCDRGLLAVTLILLLLGTAVVLDASYARALQSKVFNYDAYYFFKRQVVWAFMSIGAMMVGMSVPYWKFRRFWLIGIVVSVVLLIAVMVPGIGREVNGSRRWIGLGPLTLQPSELAKIALIIFLARYSELWRTRIQHLTKGFIPAILVVFLVAGLIAKEDLGTAISTISTGLVLICLMGARPQHVVGLIGACLAAGVGLILLEPYRMERIFAWLTLMAKPVAVHDGPAYQPAQGLIALGSGGIFGQGIMQGRIKHMYLPAEHTDYIFSTVGEETGLIGCLTVLGLFAWLIIRGLTIAHRTRDWFGSLVAAGFTAQIGCQALLNIGVVTGIFPCTGVPLPFISYGGSSLLFTALAVGIILNVSRHPSRPIMESKVRRVRESRADGWRNRRPHLSSP